MTSPLPLPDWVPPWVHVAILAAGGLFALLFLLMPFAVFGVKGRLEAVEARLDEIQAEIRSLSLRLPEPYGMADAHAAPAPDRPPPRPPIPPAPRERVAPGRTGRTEPRLF